MSTTKKKFSTALLKSLLLGLYRSRLTEEKMLVWLRQGKLSKWFSGIGQEAISVGIVHALDNEDWILPAHRNLGIFLERNLPLPTLIAQWMGHPSGFTSGRDRSFHFGSYEHRIFGMISHMGAHLPVACGIALDLKLKSKPGVVVAICGDGATSQGDFHEALNLAAVWKLPVLFVVENNGYALSTPTQHQYACESIVDRALGYGMDGVQIDGNNVLEVYDSIAGIAKSIRKSPRPFLVEALTFRIRGHEENSGTHYVPEALTKAWIAKDPIELFASKLLEAGLVSKQEIDEYASSWLSKLEESLPKEQAYFGNQSLEEDVFCPSKKDLTYTSEGELEEKRLVDALSDALHLAMQHDPHLVLMGQDIGAYGGVFKVTEKCLESYGSERVRDTPLCESAVVGAALGLAAQGRSSVVEMQFADFVTCAFNQIVNNLSATYFRWKLPVPVVIRLPTGVANNAGPYHSQSTEAWFARVPGLKVVYPASPYDAKGLLLASINDPNPVIFLEHKGLYRSLSEKVPTGYYELPLGKASYASRGDDLTIVCYGMAVHWAKKACATLQVSANIVDLRTLVPWDKELVLEAVKSTGKVLLVTEDHFTGSILSDIGLYIASQAFEYLDAPPTLCASIDTPIPFAAELEQLYLPEVRLENAIRDLILY